MAAAAAILLLSATTGVHQNTLVGTVAQIAGLSPATGADALITDGAGANDCTTGGGATQVWCFWDGSAWLPYGGSGGGGSWSEVSEVTASGTTQNLTIGSHKVLRITFRGVTVTTDDSRLSLRVDVGGVQITNYRYDLGAKRPGINEVANSQNGSEWPLTDDTAAWGIGNASGESFGCRVLIYQANSTTLYPGYGFLCSYVDPGGTTVLSQGGGVWDGGTGALDGIQVLAASSMTGGTITVEGI